MHRATKPSLLYLLPLAPFDAEPISSVPTYCPSWQLSSCLSCEESPSYLEQLVDSCLQTEAPLEPAFSACQTASHYTSDAFQPVPHCFNQGLVGLCPRGAAMGALRGEMGKGGTSKGRAAVKCFGNVAALGDQAACVDFQLFLHQEQRTRRLSHI